jgi:hypothetical protein
VILVLKKPRGHLLVLALAAVTVACGGSDDSGGPPTCESLGGQPAADVAELFSGGNGCARDVGLEERELSFLGVAFYDCDDGTTVWWNDVGWGTSAGTWTFEDDAGLPPAEVLDACLPNG